MILCGFITTDIIWSVVSAQIFSSAALMCHFVCLFTKQTQFHLIKNGIYQCSSVHSTASLHPVCSHWGPTVGDAHCGRRPLGPTGAALTLERFQQNQQNVGMWLLPRVSQHKISHHFFMYVQIYQEQREKIICHHLNQNPGGEDLWTNMEDASF